MTEYDPDAVMVAAPETSRPLWGLLAILFAMAVSAFALWLLWPSIAHAHSWYTDKSDPATNYRCCGGSDCAEIPQALFENGAISPTADGGFDVHLTAEQAQHFNKSETQPISVHLTIERVQPAEKSDAGGTGYSMCIWGGQVRCFFAPLGF